MTLGSGKPRVMLGNKNAERSEPTNCESASIDSPEDLEDMADSIQEPVLD